MATTTVFVTQLTGQAWVRDADGNLTPLAQGMRIPADANVVTASGSTVQLQADGQPPLTIGENQTVALGKDVFEDVAAIDASVAAPADPLVDNLIAAINQGQDPLAELEPTAAVLAGGGGAGSSFVRLSSVLESTSPLALAYPRGAGDLPEDRRGGSGSDNVTATEATTAAPPEVPIITTPEVLPYNGVVTLSSVQQVIEGSKIVVTATVDNPPVGSDLVITLKSGESITIPVGSMTGVTEVSTRTDEEYIQGTETRTFEVGSTAGGSYDSLDINSKTSTDVVDDTDATAVTLSVGSTSAKEDGQFVVTATLGQPAGTAMSITLSTGQVISIAAGATTGSVNVPATAMRSDEGLVQGETSHTISITGTTGGNFEALTQGTVDVKVTDDADVTTVSITALVTKTSEITIDNVSSSRSFTVTATGTDKAPGVIAIVTDKSHAGFGVTGSTSGSGDTSELGYGTNGVSEKITVAFNNEVKSFDVQFAWRNNGESARVDFYDTNNKLVGYAIVSGGGSDVLATVIYYDANNNETKRVTTAGGSDKVDLAYTFEPGSALTFKTAVFSAVGTDDDYLIHSIKYKEVVSGGAEVISGSTDVVFDIKTSNPPDASKYNFSTTFPIATVLIGGKEYEVELDRNGHGSISVTTDGRTDLTATVIAVGGNFEKVDLSTSSLTLYTALDAVDDNIITNILSSNITVDAAVLTANDHLGKSPQALADKTISTGWKGLTGVDFKNAELKKVDFDGKNNKTIENRETSINRSEFFNNLTASTASIQVDGYLARYNENSNNDEDWITVNLKAGEKLSYSGNLEGINVKYIYNGVTYSITNKTFEAVTGGDYKIYLANTTNSEKDYLLTLKVDYSDAVANDIYTLKDADGSDSANISLTYQSGNTLTGTDANNTLLAGSGNDSLSGGKGNDVLVGGKGNDTLIGGEGDDIFLWVQGDEGSTTTPARDVIKDFGRGETSKGTDTLDLRDLLQGESRENLSSYLSATKETVNGKVSTVLNISTTGHLADQGADQQIVLEGVASDDTSKLLKDLIDQGKLLFNQ